MRALLIDPFTWAFMQRAGLGTLAVCVCAPLVGWWAVARRLVYLTDAMSHAVLSGVAAAAFVGAGLLAGAFAAALVMALLVAWLTVRTRMPEDSAIGVVGQGLFALGVLGVSLQDDPRALSHVLFGNPLTVTWTDVGAQASLALVTVVAVVAATPLLTATTFDAVHARTVGMRVGVVEAALVTGISLVVVVGLSTVGVLMVVTLSVAPAVAARAWATSMRAGMALAVAVGVLAGASGLLAGYHLDVPIGPAVALAAVAQVGASVLFKALVARSRRPRQPLGRPDGRPEPAAVPPVTVAS